MKNIEQSPKAQNKYYYACYKSPFGDIFICEQNGQLSHLVFALEKIPPGARGEGSGFLRQVAAQLDEYFAGARKKFDIPLCAAGTIFQQKVWAALATIPYGATASYADIARAVGSPKACRAVGGANHSNPISIIVPCHRVIGAGGKLTGYGGGLAMKEALLKLEGFGA